MKPTRRILAAVLTGALLCLTTGCTPQSTNSAKPVIYLYPETETEISVRLSLDGELTTTYPDYGQNGWTVTAQPDGTLVSHADGQEYSYLFWEGVSNAEYDLSKGWCVPGDETAEFLQETLAALGLTPEEYNEMIVYWLPQMEKNPYNLITFQQECYTDSARLDISPQLDSLLRVFMAWKPLEQPVDVQPDTLVPFQREGFTVVEWGGCKLN